MNKITINTKTSRSLIICGEKWTEVGKYLPSEGVVIITDENVDRFYGKDFPPFPVVKIKPGEEGKKLKVIEDLAETLLKLGIDRSGFILAIGGGVVCDIAGFLSSVYMRGISCGFVSTTLLSQVDASIGGKNGVNVGQSKNILGTFSQPEFVICDPSMLSTLPEDEYLSGLAELLKMGLIMDEDIVTSIEKDSRYILNRDLDLLESLISRSVKLKADIVQEDEKESGKRMILNFGHTFGHVIETAGRQKHGFAVASGMKIASSISVKKNLLPISQKERLDKILESYRLITDFDITPSKFEEMLSADKKKTGNKIKFVLLEDFGKAIVKAFNVEELINLYKSIKS